MIRKSNIYVKNIYVSIFLLIALYTQAAWLTTDGSYYTVFLSCAFAAGFYVSFGKQVIPGIALSSVFGVIVIEMIVTGSTFAEAILYSLPMTFLNVITPFVFGGFLLLFKVTTPKSLYDGLFYILSIIFSVMIMSLFPTLQMISVHNSNFFTEYRAFFEPMFIGMVVFAVGIILSNTYDELLSLKFHKKPWQIIYFIGFTGITYLIFSSNYESFNYLDSAPLFIILFIVCAFLFNYRLLLAISWIYIVVYNIVYFRILEVSELINVSSLNVYLIVLVAVSIFIKVLIFELLKRNTELTETKARYEDMLGSTLELLKVRETLSEDNVEYQEEVMQNIFDIALRIFNDIEYGICVLKQDKKIKIIDAKGYNPELLKKLDLDSKYFRWDQFKPVLIDRPADTFKIALGERYTLFEEDLLISKQAISILIKLNDEEMGAITFDIIEGSDNQFTEGDFYNIGAFQSLINSFYEMNELTIKNNSLRDDIVLSLIRTLELYDQYTGGHSEDVAFLANEISKELNLPLTERYNIYWAGIVHDIGKIGISSDIINKKGKLTLDEYKQVQQHPIFGYEILKKSEDLKKIARLVRHHHEWYNGSGYPDGLKNKEIPFGAQILQVADSVSSMATKRSYQKEKSFEEIAKELEMYSGIQFNPEIAEVMIKLMNEKEIKNYFKTRKK